MMWSHMLNGFFLELQNDFDFSFGCTFVSKIMINLGIMLQLYRTVSAVWAKCFTIIHRIDMWKCLWQTAQPVNELSHVLARLVQFCLFSTMGKPPGLKQHWLWTHTEAFVGACSTASLYNNKYLVLKLKNTAINKKTTTKKQNTQYTKNRMTADLFISLLR